MESYLQSRWGFAIDHELADDFGILDELLLWEAEGDEIPLFEIFEEKFGVSADMIEHFEYEHSGSIHGLEGFEYDATYILFDELVEDETPQEWDNFIIFLEEEHDIFLDLGTWWEVN